MTALATVEALLSQFQLGRKLTSLSQLKSLAPMHGGGAGGGRHEPSGLSVDESRVLRTGWASLDLALPDHGFVPGVIELASPENLGGGTDVALAALSAMQKADPSARVAWVDLDHTLYAPALVAAGVDLSRLLVVRPARESLRSAAVKLASSLAFSMVVIDLHGATSKEAKMSARTQTDAPHERAPKGMKDEVFIRKLALAAEEGQSRIFVLTDSHIGRECQWPVALRLELSRRPESISLRIAKDRYGRIGTQKTLPFHEHPHLGTEKLGELRPFARAL